MVIGPGTFAVVDGDLAPILVSTPVRAETIARQASCAKNQLEVQ